LSLRSAPARPLTAGATSPPGSASCRDKHSTGGWSILGQISKRGGKYLRTLLIQAAKVLLMRPHNWARYSFGPWLNSASERLHRNKLAVALANKLARIASSVQRGDQASIPISRSRRSNSRHLNRVRD
jgi:transposase